MRQIADRYDVKIFRLDLSVSMKSLSNHSLGSPPESIASLRHNDFVANIKRNDRNLQKSTTTKTIALEALTSAIHATASALTQKIRASEDDGSSLQEVRIYDGPTVQKIRRARLFRWRGNG